MRQGVFFALASMLLGGVACRRTAEAPKKIPITTLSADARMAYEKGKVLVDNIRAPEALPLFDEAIKKDPNFALAHLLRAQVAPSNKEFFEHLKAAVAASDRVSEAERLLILGFEAGANGNSKLSGEYCQKVVAAFPQDEEAHQLLAQHYSAIQDYDSATAEFQKAVTLAPAYAPAYNLLGYSLKELDRDSEAEAAFRKYTELIPNEPNPHDSLAELLMKMGRFDESIAAYKKALSLEPQFISALRGIAANLMYQEKYKEALEQFQKQFDAARNDGERRDALFDTAVCYADQGKVAEALAAISKVSASAEQAGDKATMAFNANSRGDLLLNAGKISEARKEYESALALNQQASIPDTVKKNFELGNHGRMALIASAMKDAETAKKEAEIMRAGYEALGNPNMIRGSEELLGILALQQKSYDEAISHLNKANLRSPYVMFQLAKAYSGKKDAEQAKKYFKKTASANTLPNLRYAMVRKAAQQAAK